jgi:hypothetical protein
MTSKTTGALRTDNDLVVFMEWSFHGIISWNVSSGARSWIFKEGHRCPNFLEPTRREMEFLSFHAAGGTEIVSVQNGGRPISPPRSPNSIAFPLSASRENGGNFPIAPNA